jgi:hypothetical protein
MRTFTKRQIALLVCLVLFACAVGCSFAGDNGEDNVSCLPAVILVFCVILILNRSVVVLESPLLTLQPALTFVSPRAPPQS